MPDPPSTSNDPLASSLHSLVQPVGGVIQDVFYPKLLPNDSTFSLCIARSGDWRARYSTAEFLSRPVVFTGIGVGVDRISSSIPALVECIERYSTATFRSEALIKATAEELTGQSLPVEHIARCSPHEFSHPACPLRPLDPGSPIHWTLGVNLMSGKHSYVPASMAYTHLSQAGLGERFWFQTTSGCCAHTSVAGALCGALLELIERDAWSIAWLQMLPLPRVSNEMMASLAATSWLHHVRGEEFATSYFFDATNDLRIPVFVAVTELPYNSGAVTLVSCACAVEPSTAAEKLLRDIAQVRFAFRCTRQLPSSLDVLREVSDGASYMGQYRMKDAFKFLDRTRTPADSFPIIRRSDGSKSSQLNTILDALKERGIEAYAIDITTDEARRCGLHVIRAVVPRLQPLSFVYRARFLGNRRLYEVPLRLGFQARHEADLNPNPQPYA